MPELPEVEAARRLVEKNCLGKTISGAMMVDDDKVFDNVKASDLETLVRGRKVDAVHRLGKHMWIDFGNKPSSARQPSLLLHFGMTGGIAIKDKGGAHYKRYAVDSKGDWPPRFCKMELVFSDGTRLAFCDSRRFGRIRWLEDPLSKPPLNGLGWDPLLSMPSKKEFSEFLQLQRRAIKTLLMDQSFCAGIGNWVADEVCYQARIHPEQPANTLQQNQVDDIYSKIKYVCQEAVDANADAESLPEEWLFQHRWNKGKGKTYIDGHEIKHITVGGRTSAYVPALQKLTSRNISDTKLEKEEEIESNGYVKGRKSKGTQKRQAISKKKQTKGAVIMIEKALQTTRKGKKTAHRSKPHDIKLHSELKSSTINSAKGKARVAPRRIARPATRSMTRRIMMSPTAIR